MSITAGLDIGASSVKLAVFSGRGKQARLVSFQRYDTVAEGVLSDDELYAGIGGFLKERKLGKLSLALGIPSYEVSMKVSDYPAVKRSDLRRMVALDASQVGGLSDDVFIHDYVCLPSGLGRRNPVLLCLVHDEAVRPRLTGLEAAGMSCDHAIPSVLSLAVAAFQLIDGLSRSPEPAILLDIGQENTTLVVVAGGQVLHAGSLMFGAATFVEACSHHASSGADRGGTERALERLETVDLSLESGRSSLVQAAQTLESEMQGSLELWRSQELEKLAGTPVTHVYITGGGSRLKGLVEWLATKLDCPVSAFAPLEHGAPRPEMTVCYGLGLQACGLSELTLSLLPPDLQTLKLRQRRWPFLAAASALLVGGSLLWLTVSAISRASGAAALEEERAALQERVDAAGQLNAMTDKALAEETMVRELADCGNRGRRLLESLRTISRGTMDHGWVIYLADGRTAYETGAFFGDKVKPVSRRTRRQVSAEVSQQASRVVSSEDARPAEQFVCAGYVPLDHTDEIQGLMSLLSSAGSLFHGVDRGNSVADAAGDLIWTWRAFLNRDAKRLRKGLNISSGQRGIFADAFELFTLKLPVEDGTSGHVSGRKKH